MRSTIVVNQKRDEERLPDDTSSVKQLTNSFSILISLILSRSSRVLSVISEFVSESMRGNSIRVNDRSSSSSNHGPNATFGIEYGQLETGTGRSI